MKARINLRATLGEARYNEIQKAAKEMAEENFRRAGQQVEQRMQDNAVRALYLVLLACRAIGLSTRTLRRIQEALPEVAERYRSARNDELADEWARLTLKNAGIDLPQTEEPQ